MDERPKKRWDQIRGFFPVQDGLYLQSVIRTLTFPLNHVLVEIGSFLGRSTVCMASVSPYRVVAIDPHEGRLDAIRNGKWAVANVPPTYKDFKQNLIDGGVGRKVEVIRARAEDVQWDGRQIALLLIDGIHDREHVEHDFHQFREYIVKEGFCAFHDYGTEHYPDVTMFVDTVAGLHGFMMYGKSKKMAVMRKAE